MTHPVGGRKIIKGWRVLNLVDDLVDRGEAAVGEEDGAGLGAQGGNVTGPVILFVFAGALVLADDVGVIFVNRGAAGDADLLMVAQLEAIDVEARRLFDEERSGRFQPLEIIGGALIDFVGIGVYLVRQFQLGARDAQEAQGVIFGEVTRLPAVDDVVGNGGNLGGRFRVRTKGAKSAKGSHNQNLPSSSVCGQWLQRGVLHCLRWKQECYAPKEGMSTCDDLWQR